jgi:hypothetical protein
MPEPQRVVEVLWIDSTGHDGWSDTVTDLPTMIECRAVGIVADEGDAYMTLALAIGGAGQYLSPMCIPKAAIIDVHDYVPGGQARVPDDG